MNIVLAPDSPMADAVLDCLVSWSASALVEPFCWWPVAQGTTGTLDVRVVVDGQVESQRLNRALAERDVRRPRLVACYPAAAEEAFDVAFADAVEERLTLASDVLAFDPTSPVECDFVTVPAVIGQPVPARLFRFGWRTNVYVAPEDRSDPEAANQLPGWEGGPAPHAAHAIATLADLWLEGEARGDDVLRALSDAVRHAQGETPLVQVVRCFSRAVDLGYVADHVAAEVFQVGDAWPNPDREAFERSRDAARVFPMLADSFFDKHHDVLGLTPFEPLTLPAAESYGLVEAFKRLLTLLWRWVLRKPGELIDATVGRAHDWAAQQIERAAGPHGGIPVRRWKQRPPDERSLLTLRDNVSQPLYHPDGAVAPAWHDLVGLALALVDGSELPAGIDASPIGRGARRAVFVDPLLIVPDPAGPAASPETERACDPLAAEQAVPPLVTASLLWRVGVLIARDLRQARTDVAAEIPAPPADPQEATAPPKRRWFWPFRRRAHVRKRRGLGWPILRSTLLAAVAVAAAAKYLPLLPQLPAYVLIVVGWFLLVARAVRRVLVREQAEFRELMQAQLDIVNAEKLRAQRIGDAARLERRYNEYLDWAEIVGWTVHRPWVGTPLERIGVPPPIDRETLPAALVVGTGSLDERDLRRLTSGAQSKLFQPAWLTDLYGALERRIMRDLWLEQALDATADDANLPDPAADTSDDPELPRGSLLEAMRRGDHRSIRQNPLSDNLLGYLAGLRVDGICRGLLLGDGPEPLPPSAAWFEAPADLPDLAARLKPAVVRIRCSVDGESFGGTGVVVDPQGLVATCGHVVDGGQELRVVLPDGKELAAEVVSRSSTTDLAVLRVSADAPLPAARLAPGEPLPRQGDAIVTLGHPDLLEGEVTLGWGLIAATARRIHLDRLPSGVETIDVIQATYHAAGGASGSPVFDLLGNVIAVHCAGSVPALSDRMRDAASFAVPVRELHALLGGMPEPAGVTAPEVEPLSADDDLVRPTRFLMQIDDCAPGVSMLPQHWLPASGSERVESVVTVPPTAEELRLEELAAPLRFMTPIRVLRHRVELTRPHDASELTSCGEGEPPPEPLQPEPSISTE